MTESRQLALTNGQLNPESEIDFHEVSYIFPLMQGKEFEELKADIKEHGQRAPIFLYQDQIIDGRNRYKACRELNIEPKFEVWNGRGSLIAFVISLNLHRRHLTESQRAMIGARIKPMFEAEAKMRSGMRTDRTDLSANWRLGSDFGKSSNEAAEVVNVSSRSIERASKVLREGTPELAAAVQEGKIRVSTAATIAEASEEEQKAILALSEKEIIARAQELSAKYKAEAEAAKQEAKARQQTIITLEEQVAGLEEKRTELRHENDQAKRAYAAADACIIRQEENFRMKLAEIEEKDKKIKELTTQIMQPQVIEKEVEKVVEVEVEKRIEVIPEDYDVLKVEVNTLREKLEATYQELDKATKKLSKKEELLSLFGNEQKQARGLQKVNDGMKYIEEAYLLLKDQCLDECVRGIVEGGLQSLNRLFHNLFEGHQHEQA